MRLVQVIGRGDNHRIEFVGMQTDGSYDVINQRPDTETFGQSSDPRAITAVDSDTVAVFAERFASSIIGWLEVENE